jgi:hypothetical protein
MLILKQGYKSLGCSCSEFELYAKGLWIESKDKQSAYLRGNVIVLVGTRIMHVVLLFTSVTKDGLEKRLQKGF